LDKLTEKDIRPVVFTQAQRVAAVTDTGRFLSRYAEFVHVACPACGADDPHPKFRKNGIDYVECPGCETMYINPRPTPEVLEWFYRGSLNYAHWNKFIFPASEEVRRERIFVPRVDRLLALCRKHGVTTGALLEVGAGFGTFCTEVQRRKVFSRVVAVEPTPDLAQTCRLRGLEVIESPVEQIQLDAALRFDVVASFEVIEHLFAPGDFVRHTVALLKPGGLLMLACPNGKGFDVETLGTMSNTVDHEHLNYFNPASLSRLLASCGLEVLESLTPGRLDAELVRNKVLEGEFDLSGQPFLRKVLIDDWDRLGGGFQEYLAGAGLSSSLWMVARKPDRAA
jgi:2-polyprenyl-3-methyl-5-hydroxy-6-metoxy-1,4-benzoquinol methylase